MKHIAYEIALEKVAKTDYHTLGLALTKKYPANPKRADKAGRILGGSLGAAAGGVSGYRRGGWKGAVGGGLLSGAAGQAVGGKGLRGIAQHQEKADNKAWSEATPAQRRAAVRMMGKI